MLKIKKALALALSGALAKLCGDNEDRFSDVFSSIEYPPDKEMGDLAFPCFKYSKILRCSPAVIAGKLSEDESVKSLDCISGTSVAGGYLNFRISDGYYSGSLIPEILEKGSSYGRSDIGYGKTVVLDYSSPNVAKPFHIGHLGTTVIGHSLKMLHEFCGYKCIGINYLGDWGTQFGKLIVAFRLWGDEESVKENGVDELVALYVRFHDEAEKDPSLNDKAREEFSKLEHNDEENIRLWKWFIDISLREYQKTYRQLGITFDSYKGESFYTDKMPAQVEKLREKNLLKLDDGASIVDLSEYNMPACLILKRDGSTLYPTRDIAAAVYRKETYDFDKAIYVTAAQQSLHFAQWFKVIELMGYDWADRLVHVPYGTVSIDGLKLSTRSGNVILLRDVFSAAIDKVASVIEEKNPNLENKDEVAEAVGVGAIIFYYLMNSRIKDISFRMDDALSFEGNTGPYVQYTYARTCSVISKASGVPLDKVTLTSPEESALAFELSRFEECVLKAVQDYEPSVITRYILSVATAFNKFYHECPILSAEDENVRNSRIALTKAANTVLGSALPLICLKTPEKV
ncbi:MAG: arginine--tRNA ligase [Clostridia bacterium]|nr:arginine--tRNA ligase [Clostridia bacterium]